MPNRLSTVRQEPTVPSAPFNIEQWAEDHDRRDNERFATMAASVTNIWRVLAFVGITFVAITGWSLKTQYDQLAGQERTLHAVYGVSNQVQQVQTTVVPKPPQ